MPGPAHGIVGEDFGVELPETLVEEADLTEERQAAKFTKTREFKRLKAHFQGRIEFYQSFLPDGRPIAAAQPTPAEWQAANIVIAELKAVIGAYEQAAEVIKDAAR